MLLLALAATETLSAQPDGRILVGGNFETMNGAAARGLVRLNSDGRVDDTFDVGAGVAGGRAITGGVYSITRQQDGRIVDVMSEKIMILSNI